MLRPTGLVLACVLAVLPTGVTVQEATFRGGAQTVRVHATVLDGQGHLLTGLPSPIWDVVDRTVTTLAQDPGPRAILLLTDGAASANRFSFSEVEARAVKAGIPIYVVGARDEPFSVPQVGAGAGVVIRVNARSALQQLAASTGGSYASMASQVDPKGQVRRIMQELTSTYFLEIAGPVTAAGAPEIAPLDVRVTRPNVQVPYSAGILATLQTVT